MNRYLVIENLALRQQLAIMKQRVKRPAIRTRDRIFWMFLSMIWKDWKNALIVVQPETVIRWHRKGFKLFWRFKSKKRRTGRPSIDSDMRKLIEDMAVVYSDIFTKFEGYILTEECLKSNVFRKKDY
jgi:hypothetical protein